MAGFDVKKAIEDLKKLNWSKDNNTQGAAASMFKALAFSDDPAANKVMKYLDNAMNKYEIDEAKEEKPVEKNEAKEEEKEEKKPVEKEVDEKKKLKEEEEAEKKKKVEEKKKVNEGSNAMIRRAEGIDW